MGGIRKRKGIIVRGFIISAVFSPLNSILVLFLFLYPYTTTKASEKNCDFNTCNNYYRFCFCFFSVSE